jgi:anaerobic magnesium-protoporphyrin IX monomethyl ester cyclase
MRILLIYPPPWQIPGPGQDPKDYKIRAPEGIDLSSCLNGDILNIPQGLLSLAAQEKEKGHDVEVLNLFTFPWQEVKKIIGHFKADIYGLSVFTSNRRGSLALAELIKETHPETHITVGGPHATALAEEMLLNCNAIDTIITGEGENTFGELVSWVDKKESLTDIPGTLYRKNDQIIKAPERERITNLDSLISPFKYYDDYILISSRGCAWDCTFCASTSIWGRKHYSHSPKYILDTLEMMVNNNSQKNIAIKDETFTCNKKQVVEICEGIIKRKLNFIWSCDTRADTLDEEILFLMRKAGCQRISLGIESGSERILENINKKTDFETVQKTTRLARKFGFQIRYYMITGCRGETAETIKQSEDFVTSAKPCQAIFNPFTLFPGTKEFQVAKQNNLIDENIFFTDDFFELSPLLFRNRDKETAKIYEWAVKNSGLKNISEYSLEERKEILSLFPDHAFAFLDLGEAYYNEGKFKEAEKFILEVLDRDYPHKGIIYNYLACLCSQKNDFKGALKNLIKAREHGYHNVVEENISTVQKWIRSGGSNSGTKFELKANHHFEVTRPFKQPVTPGRIVINKEEIRPIVF